MTMDFQSVLFEPVAEWCPPPFANLSSAKRIAIDLETKDPLLKTKGPGTFRKDGYPVGIAVASDTGFRGYYPFEHFLGGNLDSINVINYFTDLLKRPDLEVVGAHLKYDLEWLQAIGIEVKGRLRDIQIAEPLLDEESIHGYGLDALAKKYLGEGKDETLLKEAASAYGFDPKADLWKLHSKYVGPYAEADVDRTLKIYDKQCHLLRANDLWSVFDLECDLIDILVKMRFQGVKVDLAKASQYSIEWRKQEEQLRFNLKQEIGFNLDPFSNKQLKSYCDQKGFTYPRTDKGNASFDKIFLTNSENPFFNKVREIRSINRLRSTYVDELIFGNEINGRIHCEFNQMRSEDGGTRTSRFSSKNPNLQQVPSRDKQLAPKIRSLFVADDGGFWAKLDYSQQEPRVLTHFGYITKMRGADKIRSEYLENKRTDFYTLVSKTSGLERKPAKDLTLGICYGEGIDKIARDLGVTSDVAKKIINTFNKANPFIKELSNKVMDKVQERGFVKTLLGHKRHFDHWEVEYHDRLRDDNGNEKEDYTPIKSLELATNKWPDKRLKRAYAYKGLNALIQGSSADMTKAAMVMIWKELKKIPMLTVHDELDYSVSGEMEATSIQFRMENCVELTVPMYAELTLGKHWK